jgi:alkaline phosphatase D
MDHFSRRQFLKGSAFATGSIVISTGLSACVSQVQTHKLSQTRFAHGVASGDPSSTSVIIWTRAQPDDHEGSATVMWELALDADFTQVIRSGLVTSQRSQDFTIKIDVQDLSPASQYYYRFTSANTNSQIGRTRTLPKDNIEQVKLVVVSCSNYPAGYFNAYSDAAQLSDIDAVLHLGDYIYEYPMGGYATDKANEIGRALAADNINETITLDDYRKRYALYRTDNGLQALHAAAPFIAVWDDHEVCNDTYKIGAENHNEGEGDFFVRRAAAIKAYYEWLPIRPPYGEEKPEIYRRFDFGNLLSLYMLDTRLIGRDKQLAYQDYRDAQNKSLDAARFVNDLNDPKRSLLGQEQKLWLQKAISQSSSQWQMLGQQVLMAKMLMPSEVFAGGELAKTPERIAALKNLQDKLESGASLSEEQHKRLISVMPYNLDAWDGYPKEREDVYEMFSTANKPLIVVAGDTHNAWQSQLKDKKGNTVGVEFATPGITSPGLETYLQLTDSDAQNVADNLTALISELEYCNLHQRGYLVVTITPQQAKAEWRFVDNILSPQYHIANTHKVTFLNQFYSA